MESRRYSLVLENVTIATWQGILEPSDKKVCDVMCNVRGRILRVVANVDCPRVWFAWNNHPMHFANRNYTFLRAIQMGVPAFGVEVGTVCEFSLTNMSNERAAFALVFVGEGTGT